MLFRSPVKFKYLKDTTNVGLWYPKGTSLNLTGFSYSDYVGFTLDRKVQIGHVIYLEALKCLGIAKSKLVSHFQLLKLNI